MDSPLLPEVVSDGSEIGKKTIEKLDRRLLSLCAGLVFLACLDRGNIGYVARDLCNALNLTHREYGLAVSLLFAGCLVSEMVGNRLLKRFGAPAWLFSIVFAWGSVVSLMGVVQSTIHLQILRFFLGVAEGGIYPAVWYLLSMFYPESHVTSAFSMINGAVAFSILISAPLSAGLLSVGSYLPIDAWRLVFIIEGLATVSYSFLLYALLPQSPETSTFLNESEKEWLTEHHQSHGNPDAKYSFRTEMLTVVKRFEFWIPSVCCFIDTGVRIVLMYWAALIIDDILYEENDNEDSEACGAQQGNTAMAALLTAIPYLASVLSCHIIRRWTIRNRPRFVALFKLGGGLALITWALFQHMPATVQIILLSCAISVSFIVQPSLVALALVNFDRSTRATAATLCTMTSDFGGFVFPIPFGMIVGVVGFKWSMGAAGIVCFVCTGLIMLITDPLSQSSG